VIAVIARDRENAKQPPSRQKETKSFSIVGFGNLGLRHSTTPTLCRALPLVAAYGLS
jgi:hypothetical protein